MTGRRLAACASLTIAGALMAPLAANAAPKGGPPPPTAANGHKVKWVAQVTGATDIAFGHGRVFVGAIGDEKTQKGAGVYVVHGRHTTLLSRTPVIGLVYSAGALYGTSQNKVIAWSGWKKGKFTTRKVIFKRPIKDLPFLEKLAVGPDGRLYMGSSAAGEKGPLVTPYSGLVLSMKRDGSDLKTVARGLRQAFGIAFLQGDASPWLSNEGDDVPPTFPPDFIVHAVSGSDFGYPACKWITPADSACTGFATPSIFFPPHSTPTGLAARGHKLYIAYFGGTTKAGPEIRTWVPNGPTKQVVRSALPLVGLAIHCRWVYFTDVAGGVYRVRT